MPRPNMRDPAFRAQAARTRLLKKEKRLASVQLLNGGAKVYEDTAPGIGFVLEFPSGRKCYYRKIEQAIDFWYNDWSTEYGLRDTQGALKEIEGSTPRPEVTKAFLESLEGMGASFATDKDLIAA